jgi:zinc/manganese transport system substrate-binding protein
MFHHITYLFLVILLLNTVQAKRLNVVTTLPSLAAITEQIGGDRINLFSITKGAQDAHYVEAKPSYMVKLHRADLLIYSGLELEIGWLPLLIEGARNRDVIPGARGNLNAAQVLSEQQILEKPKGAVDRSMGDVHPAGNPHYLLDPRIAIKVADLIADKLKELDHGHGHENFYQRNLNAFKTKMQSMIDAVEQKAEVFKGKEVVCYHTHWSYLLDWLGMEIAGYVELRPGIPPTPRHKKEIIELIQANNIKIVIISSWKEPGKAEEVAKATQAKLLILPGEVAAMPGTDDYFIWITYMVDHIYEALNQ